ncbi:zinc ribbon domain-containing protein [Saccharolobus shibatae]|uniref:ChsH2 rubredoxin-like zinc ribbon domain-containing protein n=2 Tax=Saccharolobus shibatae TaxID=2286 RepID=A0A8F5BTL8_9CREN|nr:zinc ribbon domain-containing protein [Saccharolobus shibatae]QXJ27933.1 hypothetical protein J5U23_00801 [Saccharolobus shibatae B12]QXJ31252.1 hypothetical protein J5U21_00902 [Saccharolobus shibatae]QXJ34271.1 hypothetical protein J5U22_00817 [Saccharolobus shibatae]
MIYVCKNCGYSFWVKRARCPRCYSTEFNTRDDIREGELLTSWKLTATPDGFEDNYWLCLVRINDVKIFCRSLSEPKNKMMIKENGLCEPLT